MSKSKYEAARERLATLQKERADVEAQLAEAEEKAAAALLRGESPPAIDPALQQRLRILDRAISLAHKDLETLERQELAGRLEEIAKQKQKLAGELQKARETYETAKKEFQKAEQRFGAVHLRITQALDRLESEAMSLRAKLDTPAAEEAPREADPARVQAILADFRAGKIKNYMAGQDVNADEAYQLYERDVREIREWNRRNTIAKRTTGESVPAPDCVRYYTKDHLEEIISKTETAGGLAAPAKAEGGALLKPQKVSI